MSEKTETQLAKALDLLKQAFEQIDDGQHGRVSMLRAIDAFLHETRGPVQQKRQEA